MNNFLVCFDFYLGLYALVSMTQARGKMANSNTSNADTEGEVMSLLLLEEKCTCDRHIEGEDATELEAFGRRNCSSCSSSPLEIVHHPLSPQIKKGLSPPADCSLS
ncbi:hypothetical protein AAC387_Pa04g0619 [Persea americana]